VQRARRGNQFTYALLDEQVLPNAALDREEALASLAHRFYSSRGPATVQDFAKWSGMPATDAKKGLEAVKERLDSETADGKTYWFAPSSHAADPRDRPQPTHGSPQRHGQRSGVHRLVAALAYRLLSSRKMRRQSSRIRGTLKRLLEATPGS
jgi:uncharacterized protein YcaQ